MSASLFRWSLVRSLSVVALPVLGFLACQAGGLMPSAEEAAPGAQGASSSPGAPSNPGAPDPAPSGTNRAALSVSMVDAPSGRYTEVNVDVQRVELGDAAGNWIPLSAPQKVIDLLKLQGGVSEALAAAELEPGKYPMLRLILGDRNTVKLPDGSSQPLRVPSGMQSGLKLRLDLEVQAAAKIDLVLDFDAAESIHLVRAGRNDRYNLRPVLHHVWLQNSGEIRGRITAADTSAPLGDAIVSAQVLDDAGRPAIARRVHTDAEGRYRLDLLPLGKSYVVIVQAAQRTPAYEIKHSGELALDRAQRERTFDGALQPLAASGSIRGTVTPMADDGESDTCALVQLEQGRRYLVASDVTTIDSEETFRFDGLAPGEYSVECARRVEKSSGEISTVPAQPAAATVAGDAEAQVAISF
jgi:hypothetical protein